MYRHRSAKLITELLDCLEIMVGVDLLKEALLGCRRFVLEIVSRSDPFSEMGKPEQQEEQVLRLLRSPTREALINGYSIA